MKDLACTFRDGKLFWRDWEKTPEQVLRQAVAFEACAAENDWRTSISLEFARQCREALAQYEAHTRKHAA